ncbi:MAG: rod shape-determining protein MreD [Acidobacteriia bacterium]|nr:rod shape-determining protein MreD [Terriglobia bacterium]
MSLTVSYTSREEIEVHKFSWAVSIGIPLLALFLQSFLPQKRLGFMVILDLPLLVTIFFAVSRRRPIPGLLTGAVVGTLQDALMGSHHNLNGIAKTIIGYLASSVGVKLDVDNPGSRFLMTFGFYLIHQFIYTLLDLKLVVVGAAPPPGFTHTVLAALCNGLLAVVLFAGLDRFKLRN